MTKNEQYNNIASEGRFGDTELAHVNPQEKAMLEKMGGSGTINPKTGLKEYFMFEAAGLGLSLWQGHKESQMEKEAAKEQIGITMTGLQDLQKAEGKLYETTTAQREAVTDSYRTQQGRIGEQAGEQISQSAQSAEKMAAKTGLASSGQAQNIAKESIDAIRRKTGNFREDMKTDYEGKLGQIEGSFEAQKAELSSEKERMEAELKSLQKKSHGFAQSQVLGKLGAYN
mgnify:CR=1 FL=1